MKNDRRLNCLAVFSKLISATLNNREPIALLKIYNNLMGERRFFLRFARVPSKIEQYVLWV